MNTYSSQSCPTLAERAGRREASARSWISAVVLGLLAVLAGCSSTEEDLCDYKCECQGCSDYDYDSCVHGYDNDAYDADRRGCLDYYDDLVACEDDTWWCHGTDWETGCKFERDRLHNCIK